MKKVFQILSSLALLFAVFWIGRLSVAPLVEIAETVKTDTVYRDRLVPIESAIRPATISVPRILFVKPDTTDAPSSQVAADSAVLNIAIETRTYRDSLLTAQISGPALGSYRPTLDWYEVYNQTHTITQTVTKHNRFAVTAGAGAAWTPDGIRPVVGVQIGVVLWSF